MSKLKTISTHQKFSIFNRIAWSIDLSKMSSSHVFSFWKIWNIRFIVRCTIPNCRCNFVGIESHNFIAVDKSSSLAAWYLTHGSSWQNEKLSRHLQQQGRNLPFKFGEKFCKEIHYTSTPFKSNKDFSILNKYHYVSVWR